MDRRKGARALQHARCAGIKLRTDLANFGFEILPNLLPREECDVLAQELSLLHEREQKLARNRKGGIRNLLQSSPRIAVLARSNEINAILQSRLNGDAFPIRALFFDKTVATNWFVPWHQDLVVAVDRKKAVAGFQNWSVKAGVVHVEPPQEVLEQLVTLRVHLDDCDKNNGALKVIPSSHRFGKLAAVEIARQTSEQEVFVCEVAKGGAVLMRPLLLHSSSPSKKPWHRRVLDIQYTTRDLPSGLSFNR